MNSYPKVKQYRPKIQFEKLDPKDKDRAHGWINIQCHDPVANRIYFVNKQGSPITVVSQVLLEMIVEQLWSDIPKQVESVSLITPFGSMTFHFPLNFLFCWNFNRVFLQDEDNE